VGDRSVNLDGLRVHRLYLRRSRTDVAGFDSRHLKVVERIELEGRDYECLRWVVRRR
jgi:hypothetical protein